MIESILQRYRLAVQPATEFLHFDWQSSHPPARMAGFEAFEKAKPQRGAMDDNLTFGLTLTIVGMGGTMLSLWLLSLLTSALKKVFPLTPPKHTHGTEK